MTRLSSKENFVTGMKIFTQNNLINNVVLMVLLGNTKDGYTKDISYQDIFVAELFLLIEFMS